MATEHTTAVTLAGRVMNFLKARTKEETEEECGNEEERRQQNQTLNTKTCPRSS
jgi:hypothetical protein